MSAPRTARRWGQRVFLVAVVVALTLVLVDLWPQVRPQLSELSVLPVLGSVLALTAALVLGMLSWRMILADLGSATALPVAARIYFVGQLGKYLPGSVWPVLAQMDMGHDAGVPRGRMAISFVVNMALSVVIGLATGAAVGLPALAGLGTPQILVVLAVLAIGLPVLLSGRPLNGLLEFGLRRLKRQPLEHPISRATMMRAALLYVVAWVALGLHLWLLVTDLGGPRGEALPVAIGAYALAANLGVLFVLAPAGAGVRELGIVLALASVLPVAAATAVALISRLLVTGTDAVAAALAATGHRRHRSGKDHD
jgi:hypothetical protein